MREKEDPSEERGPYWFIKADEDSPSSISVLQSLRRFRTADSTMRRRMQFSMRMNQTDVQALRHLIASERRGEQVSPKDLASVLEISSAATAKLLARLVTSGHIRRESHPSDRRAQVIFATPVAHEDVRGTLGQTHARMMAAADLLDESQRRAVVTFLDAMSEAVSADDGPGERDGSVGGVVHDAAAHPAS